MFNKEKYIVEKRKGKNLDEITLKQILEKYKTPMYVFDLKKLKQRINYIKNHLPSKVKICYAIKANTFIVKEIEDVVDRFEVCSPGEFEICKEKNINSDKIFISGINKSQQDIQTIIENSEVRFFSIESMQQLELLRKCKKNIKALIRVTSGNQFGIDIENVEEIIKNRKNYGNIEIKGIQYFSGTQKTSIKILRKELEKLLEFVKILKEKYDFTVKELEFGTGFPVYYFKDKEFDEESFLGEFSDLINSMDYEGNIVLEIGRSIVASCGVYITTVVDKKTNNQQNYAIVDGGMNHLVYYGQFMAMKVPHMDIYPKRTNDIDEKWNVCGSLCTINDILIKQLNTKLEIGDILIFKNTGAYCSTEGISLFLSRDLPSVIEIKEDGSMELLRGAKPTYKLNF